MAAEGRLIFFAGWRFGLGKSRGEGEARKLCVNFLGESGRLFDRLAWTGSPGSDGTP